MKKPSIKINRLWLDIIVLVVGIAFALGMSYLFPIESNKIQAYENLALDQGSEETLVVQEKLGSGKTIREVTKIYLRDKLIGVMNNPSVLDSTLKEIYKRDYEDRFPGTSLGLGEDVYTIKEKTYYVYENVDDSIVQYLDENDLFSILTNKITFSNGAVIYVNDIDMFTRAREQYLLNFISYDSFEILKSGKSIVPLSSYGQQDISLEVLQTMSMTKGLANEANILTTEDDIIEFFSYGYGTAPKQYYVSVEGDTVEGVAAKVGNNLSAQNLITLNPDILVSDQQLLSPGTRINITYFDSPIDVVVKTEILEEEEVYPESTKYIYDESLKAGQTIVVTNAVIGKRNVRYQETYINGVYQDEEEISSVVTKRAVQKVVRVGTSPDVVVASIVRSSDWEWWPPVAHPRVTCRYGCYAGHGGVDFQDKKNRWGLVYASADGTIVANSYYDLGGYYIIIKHTENWYTYYGHMRTKGFYKVGQQVTQGLAIGRIGMTGLATGPHVHFEMWKGYPWRHGSKRYNPCKIVKFC